VHTLTTLPSDPEERRVTDPSPPIRRGVAFAGGGIMGACYMLGVMEALNVSLLDHENSRAAGQLRKSFFDIVEDRLGPSGIERLSDASAMDEMLASFDWDFYQSPDPVVPLFDTWQGISAGSILAAGCAGRVPLVSQYLSLFRHSDTYFRGTDFFALNTGQLKRLVLKMPVTFLDFLEELFYSPNRSLLEKSTTLLSTIPEGLLTGQKVQDYVRRLQGLHGKSDSFRDLPAGVRLYVLACAINRAGEVIYFGAEPYKDFPISLAVRASCSLPAVDSVHIREPGTGRPLVLKDGGLSRSINITYSFQQAGLDFVLAINPIVPLRTDLPLEFDNLPAMAESYYRILYYQRSYRYRKQEDLYRKYRGKFLLIEPDPREWYFNLLNPYRRTESLLYGFEHTLLRFYNEYDEVNKVLANGQLRLRSREMLRQHVARIDRRRRQRVAADRRSAGKALLRFVRDTYGRLALGESISSHRQW
jgi:predicted acylesterase/phospholipase RssA